MAGASSPTSWKRHPRRSAVVRIVDLFTVERGIKGASPDERRRVALPQLTGLRSWLEEQLKGLSSDSALAKACRYPLNRWAAMISYCDDALLEISNNLVENARGGTWPPQLDVRRFQQGRGCASAVLLARRDSPA